MINIRSGDDLRGQVPGDYLVSVWPVHEGPPPPLSAAESAELDRLSGYERIVLWFEHCWFCQAVLVRLLPELAARDLTDRLWLVSSDRFLGPLDAATLASLTPSRVTTAQVDLAGRALRALAAPTPEPLQALVDEADPALPYLPAAVRRHLQDLPWTTDGLALTARLVADAVARGARTLPEIFTEVWRTDPAPWMGDSMLEPWLSGGRPEWLGGVQVGAGSPWRWDPQADRVSRTG